MAEAKSEFTIPSKDAAPAKRRGRPPGSKNKPKTSSTDAALREGLESYVGLIGAGLSMFPATQADGAVILAGGDKWVESTMALAKSDARVRKALETALTGGVWGGFIISTAAIAVPIAANHGMVPAFVGNLVSFAASADDEDTAEAFSSVMDMPETQAGFSASPGPAKVVVG